MRKCVELFNGDQRDAKILRSRGNSSNNVQPSFYERIANVAKQVAPRI